MLEPAFGCPNHALATLKGLASVVGQGRVLIVDIGIEEGQVDLPSSPCLQGPRLQGPCLQECSKVLHVLLRHRLLLQPYGFEGRIEILELDKADHGSLAEV